uniref:Uncharacterized protein n=1 Tax=Utricularia reniformis TaxID=192314 RepID=A0A1Y0B366_9LAMI|nr:hypothetical protein AEK19_MT1694 [Utricularia reniformis]ART31875.1 hypothetical protein AEK19_MT1694 [Utricularia reniformis]
MKKCPQHSFAFVEPRKDARFQYPHILRDTLSRRSHMLLYTFTNLPSVRTINMI